MFNYRCPIPPHFHRYIFFLLNMLNVFGTFTLKGSAFSDFLNKVNFILKLNCNQRRKHLRKIPVWCIFYYAVTSLLFSGKIGYLTDKYQYCLSQLEGNSYSTLNNITVHQELEICTCQYLAQRMTFLHCFVPGLT